MINKNTSNTGYTLIEIIIVIALIALTMSMITITWRFIFTNNVESFAEQYNSDLRRMKNDTMSSQGDVYYLQWKYNSTEDFYYYEIYKLDTPSVLIKTVEINSSINVELDKTGSFLKLETYASDEIRIEFDASTGKLKNVLDMNGGGEYRFISDATDKTAIVSVIEETGRVFLDE